MAKIQIYTQSYCPYCTRAKEFVKSKGLDFEEINLDGKDEELNSLKNRTGHRTIPQIFVDDKFIGGYTDLVQLELCTYPYVL
jgi:GrxC family glutaredoxin